MKWFDIEKVHIRPLAPEDEEWDQTKKYYNCWIYYDTYGIFDFIKDKWNLVTYISKMYISNDEIWIDFFVRSGSHFDYDFSYEYENKLLRALEYIYIHLKRWNLVINILTDEKKNIFKKFNIFNADDMQDYVLKYYNQINNTKEKKDFLEYNCHVLLSEKAKKEYIYDKYDMSYKNWIVNGLY